MEKKELIDYSCYVNIQMRFHASLFFQLICDRLRNIAGDARDGLKVDFH